MQPGITRWSRLSGEWGREGKKPGAAGRGQRALLSTPAHPRAALCHPSPPLALPPPLHTCSGLQERELETRPGTPAHPGEAGGVGGSGRRLHIPPRGAQPSPQAEKSTGRWAVPPRTFPQPHPHWESVAGGSSSYSSVLCLCPLLLKCFFLFHCGQVHETGNLPSYPCWGAQFSGIKHIHIWSNHLAFPSRETAGSGAGGAPGSSQAESRGWPSDWSAGHPCGPVKHRMRGPAPLLRLRGSG